MANTPTPLRGITDRVQGTVVAPDVSRPGARAETADGLQANRPAQPSALKSSATQTSGLASKAKDVLAAEKTKAVYDSALEVEDHVLAVNEAMSLTGTESTWDATTFSTSLTELYAQAGPVASTTSGQVVPMAVSPAQSSATVSWNWPLLIPLTFVGLTAGSGKLNSPALALGSGLGNGATAGEATAAAGVVTVTGEAGATVVVTFSRSGGGTVSKTVSGNGASPVAVTLSAADLATLGDGTISVTARQSYSAGNAQTAAAASASFVLDTVAPVAPVLALGSGLGNGATAGEATAAAGVVTVTGEAGATVVVTFSRSGGGTVSKTVSGNGASPVAVTLSAADLATLGDGTISVTATQSDAAGNAQTAAAASASFVLDTVAPVAPVLALGSGPTQVLVTSDVGTNTSVSFRAQTSGETVTKTLLGTGAQQTVALSQADLDMLGDGTILIDAQGSDAAGNASGKSNSLSFVSADMSFDVNRKVLFVGNSASFGRIDPVQSYNAYNQQSNPDGVRDLTAPVAGTSFANLSGSNLDEPHPWSGVAGLFDVFAKQLGMNFDVSLSTRNAATLAGHYLNTSPAAWDLRSNLASQVWDMVVLQDQTDRPLTPGHGTITFAAGSPTAALIVTPTADTRREFDESLTLSLKAGTGIYTAAKTTGVTASIRDDDVSVPAFNPNVATVTVQANPGAVWEDGNQSLVFTFTRTGSTASDLTINFTPTRDGSTSPSVTQGTGDLDTQTAPGTSTPASVYRWQSGSVTQFAQTASPTNGNLGSISFSGAGSGSITIKAGQTTATLTLDPRAETTVEADESVYIALNASSNYNLGTLGKVTGTILNDDGMSASALPTVNLLMSSDTGLYENVGGSFVYIFTRTGDASQALAVDFNVDGTATYFAGNAAQSDFSLSTSGASSATLFTSSGRNADVDGFVKYADLIRAYVQTGQQDSTSVPGTTIPGNANASASTDVHLYGTWPRPDLVFGNKDILVTRVARPSDGANVMVHERAFVDGATVKIAFDEVLDSSQLPASAAFTVNSTSGSVVNPIGVSGVSVQGNVLVLTLSSAVVAGRYVTLSYSQPFSGGRLQDMAGNGVASFDGEKSLVLYNNTGNASWADSALQDAKAPVLQQQGDVALATVAANTLYLSLSEAMSANLPGASAFTVKVNGVNRTVSAVSLDATNSNVVVLTLATPVNAGETVTLSYADPSIANDANALQDLAGNDARTLANLQVRNATGETLGNLHDQSGPGFIRADGVVSTATEGTAYHTSLETMASDLAQAYSNLAKQPGFADAALVGNAFVKAIQAGLAIRDPSTESISSGKINLFYSDNLHADVHGSYLSSLVLTGTLLGVDPRSLGVADRVALDLGIAPSMAKALQRIATETLNEARAENGQTAFDLSWVHDAPGRVQEVVGPAVLTTEGTFSFSSGPGSHTVTVLSHSNKGSLNAEIQAEGPVGQVLWRYSVANDAIADWVAADQTRQEHFTLMLTNQQGAVSLKDIVVDVRGAGGLGDSPVWQAGVGLSGVVDHGVLSNQVAAGSLRAVDMSNALDNQFHVSAEQLASLLKPASSSADPLQLWVFGDVGDKVVLGAEWSHRESSDRFADLYVAQVHGRELDLWVNHSLSVTFP